DTGTLAASVLGREPARWAAAFSTDARGCGDHRPPDLREAGVRARAMVPKSRKQNRAGRLTRAVVSRRVCALRGLACRGRWRAALAADSGGRGSALFAAEIRGHLRDRLSRRPGAPPIDSPAKEFSHHHQSHCHARLSQPVRLLLSGYRGLAYAVSNARSQADRRGISGGFATL